MTDQMSALKTLRESTSNKIDSVKHKIKKDRRLADRFQKLQNQRIGSLDEAREMAKLVFPGMYEGSATDTDMMWQNLWNQESLSTNNQSLISKGVLQLGWALAQVILPSDGDYFKHNATATLIQKAQEAEAQRSALNEMMGQSDPPNFIPIHEQINQSFVADDNIGKQSIADSNHQEVLNRCAFHACISGLSVFGHLGLYEAKCYTIQNSAVVFDSSHEAVEVIVVDNIPMMDLPESVRNRILGSRSPDSYTELEPEEMFVKVYTRQIRISRDKLRVETEIEGIRIPELEFEVDKDAPALIPVPFMFVNELDPHPIGWLSFLRGDCNAFDNVCLSLEGMAMAAGLSLVANNPGMRLTSQELRSKVGLDVVNVADGKPLSIVTAPIAANMAQMVGWQDKKERQLMLAFGMDFAIQRPGERVTKEEIQRMSHGLEKLFGATFKQMERSFQQKHVRRQFSLLEDAGLVKPIPKEFFTLTLTAGLNKLKAEEEQRKMGELVQVASAFGPLGMQSFSKDALLQWFANRKNLEVEGVLLSDQEQAEQLGISQLLQTIRQLGPQGPQMVAQMLMQMMGQQGQGNS